MYLNLDLSFPFESLQKEIFLNLKEIVCFENNVTLLQIA